MLLVVDAMTGQDAVNVAEAFAGATDFDGVILSKLDGDARGGAALSVKAITGKPILYASTGEKLDAFERFHPDRMAQRILGMGDVMTLIEKAESRIDERQAQELERKIKQNQFTLDDFLEQLQQVRIMGPLQGLLKMIPGMGQQLGGLKVDDRELDRLQAIITSMTPAERANPKIIDGSRRRRIAQGSGTTVQAVSHLVKQFAQMQKVMKPDLQGQDAQPAAARRAAANLSAPCPSESGSREWAARRTRSGAWSSPTSARRAMAASSRSIGHYNPQTEPSTIVIDHERLDHWIERGAQPTNTVRKLMRAENTGGRSAARRRPRTPPTRLSPSAEAAEPRPRPSADAAGRGRRRACRRRPRPPRTSRPPDAEAAEPAADGDAKAD